MPINELRTSDKRLAIVHLLDENLLPLLREGNFKIEFTSDANMQVTSCSIVKAPAL